MASYTTVAVTPGVGAGIAVDVVGGADFQRVKVSWGVEGAAVDISASNPLPVTTVIGSLSVPTTQGLSWTKIDSAAGGNIDVVAGVAAQTIRVFALLLVVATTVTVQIADSTPTTFTGAMTFTGGSGIILDPVMGPNGLEPWYVTASGKAFRLVMGSAVQISGMVGYKQS